MSRGIRARRGHGEPCQSTECTTRARARADVPRTSRAHAGAELRATSRQRGRARGRGTARAPAELQAARHERVGSSSKPRRARASKPGRASAPRGTEAGPRRGRPRWDGHGAEAGAGAAAAPRWATREGEPGLGCRGGGRRAGNAPMPGRTKAGRGKGSLAGPGDAAPRAGLRGCAAVPSRDNRAAAGHGGRAGGGHAMAAPWKGRKGGRGEEEEVGGLPRPRAGRRATVRRWASRAGETHARGREEREIWGEGDDRWGPRGGGWRQTAARTTRVGDGAQGEHAAGGGRRSWAARQVGRRRGEGERGGSWAALGSRPRGERGFFLFSFFLLAPNSLN
jgi:hypothetical protein